MCPVYYVNDVSGWTQTGKTTDLTFEKKLSYTALESAVSESDERFAVEATFNISNVVIKIHDRNDLSVTRAMCNVENDSVLTQVEKKQLTAQGLVGKLLTVSCNKN